MNRVAPAALVAALFVTLVVRLIAMRAVDAAGVGDPNYYNDVAEALARGDGLTSRCAWNLLALTPTLPGPACAYWGPGVPAVVGAAYAVFGIAIPVAQGAMIAMSLALVVLALMLTARLTERGTSPLAVGLLLAFHLQLTYFGVTVDTPVVFAVAVNACLLPLALGHAGWTPGFALAVPGALAAQLTRADGLLLPALVLGFAALAVWRGRLARGAFVLVLLLYLAGWGGWLARNARAFGTPFPSKMSEGLFLEDYTDLFRITRRPSFERFAALGARRILADKASALVDNLKTLVFGENKLIVALAALSLPALWRNPIAIPYLAYLVSLTLAMTLAFNHQSKFGSFLHSLPSLFPFLAAASLLGVERGLARIATWTPGRHRFLARTTLTLAPWLVIMFAALTTLPAVLAREGFGRPFGELKQTRANLQAWWQQNGGPDVRLMSNDSLDLTGLLPAPVVQEPRDPGLEPVFELARRYRLKYLVIFRAPRYTTRPWDQPRYEAAGASLTRVAELPAQLSELDLNGIAIFEFHL